MRTLSSSVLLLSSLFLLRSASHGQPTVPFVPDPNTMALWHLNETVTGVANDTAQFHNHASSIGTTVEPGRFGNARGFNGFNQYLFVADPPNGSLDFGMNQSFTVEAWFKTSSPNLQVMVRKGIAPFAGYNLQMNNGRVQAMIGNREDSHYPDTILILTSTQRYDDGLWHHTALVRNRAIGRMALLVDGQLAAQPINDFLGFSLETGRPVTIGRWEVETMPLYFVGSIDEVRVSNTARYEIPAGSFSDTVAVWHYDETSGNNVFDSSPYGNHGSATGTTIVPGRFGHARSFSGSYNYVYVPYPGTSSMNFGPSQSFTIRAWFNTTQTDTGEIIRRGLAPVPGFALRILDGHVQGIVGNREDGFPPDTLLRINSTRSDYNDGQWHVATLVRDRSVGRIYLYVDDQLAAPPMNDNFPYPLSNDRPLTMGAWENFVRPTFYNGLLDEVSIMKGARHPVVVASDTLAWYRFDETSGTNVGDSSPYGNHGNAYGTTIVSGVSGNARNFSGSYSYVYIPSPLSLNFDTTQSFTIEAWFRTMQQNVGEIVRRGLAPLPGFALRIFNGKVQGIIGNREDGQSPDTLLRITSTQSYNDGAWHQVRLVRDRSLGKLFLYVDGVLATTPLNDPIPFALYNTRPLTIGCWENFAVPTFFNGMIDEVRIQRGAQHPSTAPDIEVTPADGDFGLINIGSASTLPITVRNLSVFDTLRVTGVASNNPVFTVNQTAFIISPNSSHMLEIAYTPVAAGVDTGSVVISSNDPDEPLVYVHLRGRGFFLEASPMISSIRDIPDDQGKQVRVIWYRSIYDGVAESLHVNQYSLWRKVALATDLWDFIVTVPAVQFPQYSYVAPTLYDSTAFSGIRWSVFRVAAHSQTGQIFFSAPDSGYSVDNLRPNQPSNVIASLGQERVTLTWDQPPDPDILEFAVYRSRVSNFVPSESNRIGVPRSNIFVDHNIAGSNHWYYRIAAFDSSGNQSAFSEEVVVVLTGIEQAPPTSFALLQNFPNPFNPSTLIRYEVPQPSRVTIQVYDMLGREVATLLDEQLPAGRHSVRWNADGFSSGVYMYRMQAGGFTASRKLVLMK
jgi:hypothetical protein